MFQVGPNLFKINATLLDIRRELDQHPGTGEVSSIEDRINEVSKSIGVMLRGPINTIERDSLLEIQREVQSLAGKCDNLARRCALQLVIDSKVASVRDFNLTAYTKQYNLTPQEKIAIATTCVVPLQVVTPPDFNELIDKAYQLAVFAHRNDRGSYLKVLFSLDEPDRKDIERHVKACGGSLTGDGETINTIRALVGFAEHMGSIGFTYPTAEEALHVVEDLDPLYE